jgi:hypothetical protein
MPGTIYIESTSALCIKRVRKLTTTQEIVNQLTVEDLKVPLAFHTIYRRSNVLTRILSQFGMNE